MKQLLYYLIGHQFRLSGIIHMKKNNEKRKELYESAIEETIWKSPNQVDIISLANFKLFDHQKITLLVLICNNFNEYQQ